MKKLLLTTLLLASGLVSANANADFSGAYAVGNWTTSLNGGSISTSAAPGLVTMISSDDGFGPDDTDFTISALGSGLVSFNWAYINGDAGGSFFDPFGYLLNGTFTQLTTDGEYGAQSGTTSFAVAAGDVFGFRIFATDSLLGSSYASIREFSAPVPEPEGYAMLLAGLSVIGLIAKRRSAAY